MPEAAAALRQQWLGRGEDASLEGEAHGGPILLVQQVARQVRPQVEVLDRVQRLVDGVGKGRKVVEQSQALDASRSTEKWRPCSASEEVAPATSSRYWSITPSVAPEEAERRMT